MTIKAHTTSLPEKVRLDGDHCFWKTSWKLAIVLTASQRIIYSFSAALMVAVQPVHEHLMRSNALTEGLTSGGYGWRSLLIGPWERFDTLWYLHIAARGYDRPDAIVFFPLYPALIKVLSVAIPPVFAALAISTVATFFLLWGLQELLKPDCGGDLALRAAILCAVWPASFIFYAGYAESLLLAMIVWGLRMAQKNHWAAAILFAATAAFTKAIGLVVVVPLTIMAFRNRRDMIAPLALVVVACGACVEYLQHAGGETLSVAYRSFWRTTTAPPWNTIYAALWAVIHAPNAILILNLLCLVSICTLATVSHLRIEYLLYGAVAVGVILCKQTIPPLQSTIRYMLIVFPAFVGAARIGRWLGRRLPFVSFCLGLFIVNMGLLWLFEGWSLVL